MSKRTVCGISAAWLLIGTWAAGAVAEDRTPAGAAAPEDKVSRLETLLEAQQRKIQALEQQVAVASGREQDKERADLMRKQIREILSEQEFRESMMPSTAMAGYDDGFFIRGSDDSFLMRINGHYQFRWTHYATRADNRYLLPKRQRDDRTGFDVQRMRVGIGGHVFDKDLTYQLEMRADAPDRYNFRIHYAWVNYRFIDELQFKAGIFRLASTRAQVLSEAEFQFMDGPLSDAVFGLGIGTGVRIWGQLFHKKLDYFIDVVNSLNSPDNRTITTDPAENDNNPAILFRAVWHALGEEKDFVTPTDLPMHKCPVLDLAFHYAFNEDAGDLRTSRLPFSRVNGILPGGFGLTNTNGMQINQFGFDGIFKYCGFSTTAEYYFRLTDPRRAWRTPFTPYWLLTGDGSDGVYHGAYVQAGYFLPIPCLENKLEIIARVGGVCGLDPQNEGTWEYAGGVNYYIKGNKVKLQADVTKVSEVPITSSYSSLANVNDDALIFRVQLQVAF